MLVKSILSWFTAPVLGFHSGSPTPSTPPPPEPLKPPPIMQSPQGQAASDEAARRAKAAFGLGSTIMTGPQGLTAPATVAKKVLTGS